MKFLNKINLSLVIVIVLLGMVSALAYLPRVTERSYYWDDWYYILDHTLGGPGTFVEMFKIDRPARGPLFELYFDVFGTEPLPYHLSAYAWRLLSGLAALWLFRLLWPKQPRLALTGALLYTLYPGYLWWVEGIEYQPMILSACLQTLSFALTLQALRTTRRGWKILSVLGAILTGWGYLALVEYALGMEVFRWLCIYLVISEESAGQKVFRKVKSAFQHAWLFLAIPTAYLGWMLFFFQSQRQDTNLAVQVGKLLESPGLTGLWWLVRTLRSALNVGFLAWGAPFYQEYLGLRLRDVLVGFALAAAAALITWFLLSWSERAAPPVSPGPGEQGVPESIQAVSLGALGVLFGVLPIIVANRWIEFERFSHYALPASLAGAALVAGFLAAIQLPRLRQALLLLLVADAVFTHYAVNTHSVLEEQAIQEFWWQVTWRAPGIQPGATLVASYPEISIGEDRDFVWGPANLIYYPRQTGKIPVHYVISALSMIKEALPDVQAGGKSTYGYRTHVVEIDYDNLLVLSQPAPGACVHALDSRWLRLSTADSALITLLAPRSRIANIQPGQAAPTPPSPAFGPEPEHTWCYFYEKAELALQSGDWQQVASLDAEADRQGLRPVDRVEWMPFLQAAAYLGDATRVQEIAPRVNDHRMLKQQACQALKAMPGFGYPLPADMPGLVQSLFCEG